MNQEQIVFERQNQETRFKNVTFSFPKYTIKEAGLDTLDMNYMQQFKEHSMPVEMMIGLKNGDIVKTDNFIFMEEIIYDFLRYDTIPADDTIAMINLLKPFWPLPYVSYNLPPNKNSILDLQTRITEQLIEELNLAKEQGKQLLILVADFHSTKDSFLINLITLKAVATIGITNYFIEWPSVNYLFNMVATIDDMVVKNYLQSVYKLLEFAINLKMNLIPIDPKQEKYAESDHDEFVFDERNEAMTKTIANEIKDKDAVLIVGAAHFFHLMESSEIKKEANIFFVIPHRINEIDRFFDTVDETSKETEEHVLVANIIGNPLYLSNDQIYDLVA